MSKNGNLSNARKAKNDEFYTQYVDIERELGNYHNDFRGKVIYCNTDDQNSNFFMYFAYLFEALELKELVATKYVEGGHGIKTVYRGDKNGNLLPDADEFEVSELEGDGSFDSAECIEILKGADIVATNPPFSLFRRFIALMMEYNKKFIVVGNMNAVTYKEIFPLFKENKVWFGYKGIGGASMKFYVPDSYPLTGTCCGIDEEGRRYVGVSTACWFTNLDTYKRHYDLDFRYEYKKDAAHFPKYDNYDVINVNRTDEIPMDYPGVMGVPITFLDKYNPEQFEILGITEKADYLKDLYIAGCEKYDRPYINGERKYPRLLIRFKEGKIDPFGWGIATPDRDWVANPQTYEERKERYRRPIEK